MKDLIIGCCSGYKWEDVRNWVNSIRRAGFRGDVALVGTDLTKAFMDKLTQEGIIVKAYGQLNRDTGDVITPKGNQEAPHVQRFFFIWEFLESTKDHYRYVVTTDTRDVIFQKDPTGWLEEHLYLNNLVASSEGIQYKNEPWGRNNILQTFGMYFHRKMEENMIFNVGVIAGNFRNVKSLLLMIYQMSIGRSIKVVDQAVFNMILMDASYQDTTVYTTNEDAWAIQLGTTLPAVQSGAGDLGQNFQNVSFAHEYGYTDKSPRIEYGIGLIYNQTDTLFNIVHQYDRIPELKKVIDQKYGDNVNDEFSRPGTTFHIQV